MTAEDELTRPDKTAETAAALHPLLAQRWSPRVLDPAVTIDDRTFTALFEAARWAPSWGNTQPARFIAGRRGEGTFERIHRVLSRGNRGWAGNAAMLVIGVARKLNEDGEPMPYGEYGLGLAAENLVLQAEAEGLHGHQMAGFDAEAARAEFGVPDDFEPKVAIAVGALGDLADADDGLRDKELRPRSRKPLDEIVFTGSWSTSAF
ncbi:nitroreductase family protein [Saccharopolyspora griseoalba]|uniref:Nitroreductase family protein n=1 Tax=Saccharopolyspora griseoalba TaxID=1431848 RepID=A0ABW2LIM6_9PSEU